MCTKLNMSDDSDGHGEPSGRGHSRGGKSKTDSARVPSVLLALTGVAIVAIQIYIFITFGDDGIAESYGPFYLYNGMAITSGSVSFITGILCLCCVSSKRSPSTLGFIVFMAVLAAIGAAGSTAVAVIESSKIGTDDPKHPCTFPPTINCSLWLDLEIAVAALSGVTFILALTIVILISKGIRQSKVKGTPRPPLADVQWRAASICEMVEMEPHRPEEIVTSPVIVEQVIAEIEQSSSSSSSSEEEQGGSVNISRGPYIEQLKMLSREELERRLGEHMQHQFLEELRHELGRRNLIPIHDRVASIRSTNSSTKSRSSIAEPAPAPRPDYYQEPLGFSQNERF